MRRILIERARRKSRLRHGGRQERVDLAEFDVAAAMPDEKILLVDEALEHLKEEKSRNRPGRDLKILRRADQRGNCRDSGHE
jgi:hypothetical protein